MQFITGSTGGGRQFSLGGLPALIIGVLVASVAGAVVLAVGIFGVALWGGRKILSSLLGLFGAADASPRFPTMHGERQSNTIEMRRDTRGAWRRE